MVKEMAKWESTLDKTYLYETGCRDEQQIIERFYGKKCSEEGIK